MKRLLKRQEGQSILIVALALVALVALMALVVDAGNSYVQRRQMQNAMDAGAQAASVALSQGKSSGGIQDAIDKFVRQNGVDPNRVNAYYVVQNAQGANIVVRTNTIRSYGYGSYPTTLNVGGVDLPIIGIQVEGDKTFDTYLAGVVGWKTMQVSGGAACYAKSGPCSTSGLFPVTLEADTFMVNGQVVLHTELDEPGYIYKLWENGQQIAPGNLGYWTWNGDPSANALAQHVDDPTTSGTRSVNQWLPAATGMLSSVSDHLRPYIDNRKLVTIPVYDTTNGLTSSNLQYKVKGFARFRITCYRFASNNTWGTCQTQNPSPTDKFIEAKLQQWIDAQAEGGCADFGGYTAKCRPPIDVQRALAVSVKIAKITIANDSTPLTIHEPVDVVEVVDLSSSMSCDFRGYQTGTSNCYPGSPQGPTKLQGAKTALNNFNANMQPNLGDRGALVTFPLRTTGTNYCPFCTSNCSSSQKINYYQWGEVKRDFTTNITGTNGISSTVSTLSISGNTPSASAMAKARDLLLNRPDQGNVPVIIFASDGRANVRNRDNPGYYAGNNCDYKTCNQPSVDDLTYEATQAKSKGLIIFSIAIGQDFNGNANIATPDTDPTKPHVFQATDAASMQSIYQQIADRLKVIQTEKCIAIQTEAFAPGAQVTIRYPGGTTETVTTTSTGEFILTGANVVEGTYTIQSAWVTIDGIRYDVLTNGVGGEVLTSYPTITLSPASGTYKMNISLKTDTTITCPGQ